MLVELSVVNLVIVERAVIAPGEGLTVITGETGAGKSLLLDALDLVTGARARPGLVGRWGDSCTVTAAFHVSDALARRLAEATPHEVVDGHVVLRRRISEGGRSQAWINDLPVSLGGLRAVADHLVDLHAQHEPIRLAEPAVQLGLIDAFGGLGSQAQAYYVCHREVVAVQAALRDLLNGERESVRELDYVRYQLQEIEALDPQEGEWARLEQEYRRLSAFEAEREIAHEMVALLRDREPSVAMQVARLARKLEGCQDPRLQEVAVRLAQTADDLRDVASTCDRILDAEGVDADELQRVSSRIDAWNGLLRKYGPDERALLDARARLAERLVQLEGLAERRAGLQSSLEQLIDQRGRLGAALASQRREVFARLADEVHRHLGDLGMPKAVVRLAEHSTPQDPTEHGTVGQWIEVTTNPGVKPGTLREVASGGEAARLMLALSAALAQADGIPVIVYDEVDSGVGGRLGGIIGAKLAQLSAGRTVLAVTHTPQLAAAGSTHYRVEKVQSDQATEVRVIPLQGDLRVAELSDMFGGGAESRAQAVRLLSKRVSA